MRIDIESLLNPRDRKFIASLKNASLFADYTNAEAIFKAVLSHFDPNRDITKKTGISILQTIAAIMQRPKCTSIFISSKCLLRLPYGQFDYADLIFDIFRIAYQTEFDFFEKDVVERFSMQIQFNPRKALTLIALYAQQFEYIRFPYGLLDVLINHYSAFLFSDCASNFLSLLSFLCTEYPDYKKNRSQKCWTLLAQYIASAEGTLVKQAFDVLFEISIDNDLINSCFSFLSVPHVIHHLKDPYLRDEVISFVAVCADQFQSAELISALIEEARTDTRAALVLMKLVEQEENAIFIMTDDYWMHEQLPTYLDTMKIVFTAIEHKRALKLAQKSKRIVPLLIKASDTTKIAVFVMILGIIQKINLTKKRVMEMSKYGLLKNIFRATNANDNIVADRTMYMIFQCIAKVSYVPELLELSKLAADDIIKETDLYKEALDLVYEMLKHNECISQLKKIRLIQYFKRIRKDEDLDERAKQIISILRKQIPRFDKDDSEDMYEYEEEDYYSYD